MEWSFEELDKHIKKMSKEEFEKMDKQANEEFEARKKMTPVEICAYDCKKLNSRRMPERDKNIYDCKKCNNSGIEYYYQLKDWLNKKGEIEKVPYLYVRPCECEKIRDTLIRLKKSGLGDFLQRITFDCYKTPTKWQQNIKDLAMKFISSNVPMFFVGGNTGSGKTTICTAITRHYFDQNKSVQYIVWSDFIGELKSNLDLCDKKISDLQNVDVLYIDDLFKFEPTKFEIDTLYKIINYRYLNNLKTIISSELKLLNCVEENAKNSIMDIDSAVGGRIYEKTNKGEFAVGIPNKKEFNVRFKKIF